MYCCCGTYTPGPPYLLLQGAVAQQQLDCHAPAPPHGLMHLAKRALANQAAELGGDLQEGAQEVVRGRVRRSQVMV